MEPTPAGAIKVGDQVKITGSKYYTGKAIPGWVKNKTWIVHEVSGDRVVINKSTDGKCAIMSPVKASDLQLVSAQAAKPVSEKVTTPYLVRVTIPDLNIRKGPGTTYDTTGKFTGKGCFTIVEERDGWGRLKSGAGWICLDYTTRI